MRKPEREKRRKFLMRKREYQIRVKKRLRRTKVINRRKKETIKSNPKQQQSNQSINQSIIFIVSIFPNIVSPFQEKMRMKKEKREESFGEEENIENE